MIGTVSMHARLLFIGLCKRYNQYSFLIAVHGSYAWAGCMHICIKRKSCHYIYRHLQLLSCHTRACDYYCIVIAFLVVVALYARQTYI
jgi:hypothetical protein